MQTHSHVISVLNQGLILDVTLGELDFTAYVVVSEPDLDRVAEVVPQENYDRHNSLHVAAIDAAYDAHDQISDLAFNMSPGDAAVLLCRDEAAYAAALHELGQQNSSARPS